MDIPLINSGLIERFDSYDKSGIRFNHGVGIISSILKMTGMRVVLQEQRGSGFEL